VGQAEFIGLTVPDPDLNWNEEAQHYDFGEIDWNEFYEVIKGRGPCNKQRLETHIKSHQEGEWVRDTAREYNRLKQEVKKELV
jgi:ring-1,2-phenylacetyl-CoA epoxidase subunit PaaA